MKYCVYKIVNSEGVIEWIGETSQPNIRWSNHRSESGRFAGREDIEMVIIETFDTKAEAYDYQIELQIRNGLITDNDKKRRIGEDNPKTKLTNEQVREIKAQYKKGLGAEIGRRYGVSRMVVGRIMKGQSYKYLD